MKLFKRKQKLSLSHDQVWALEELTKRHGYNGYGYRLEKNHGEDSVTVHYFDENRVEQVRVIDRIGKGI